MKKTTKRIVIGVAAFVAVICGLSSLVVTKENEYTLIMRFGKINSIKTEAGLSFKVPFLDSEQTLPKEILLYDMAASDVITKDKKTMIARLQQEKVYATQFREFVYSDIVPWLESWVGKKIRGGSSGGAAFTDPLMY